MSEYESIIIALKEELQLLREENKLLKDEILRLKGEKGRPIIKTNGLESKQVKKNKTRRASKKLRFNKTKKLKIHITEKLEPANIPQGSRFIGYQSFYVQDLSIEVKNTRYKLARYKTPAGKYICAVPPIKSHFGVELKAFILNQYYQIGATQNLILKQLQDFGILISAGQVNNILIKNHDLFHKEKVDILAVGLKVSNYIEVDDTGARHQGKNGYCTRIGNDLFTFFSSTASKSRINFLELLRNQSTEYVINEDSILYCELSGLAKKQLSLLKNNHKRFGNKEEFLGYLKQLNITRSSHIRAITEAGLLGIVIENGVNPELVIMSDEAGQFQIVNFLNVLCWVHAERHVNKLIGFSEENTLKIEQAREKIWQYYQELKEYKKNPRKEDKEKLENKFDEIFNIKTGFTSLDKILNNIYENKKQMLLVLDKPFLPLHNNLSENDIREYVKRRKISGTTRSDEGRDARDTFLSLKKTCLKLGIIFWDYLKDRLSGLNQIMRLSELIRIRATVAT